VASVVSGRKFYWRGFLSERGSSLRPANKRGGGAGRSRGRGNDRSRRDEGAAAVATASWGLAKWPHSVQNAQKNEELIDMVKPLFTLAKDFFCVIIPPSPRYVYSGCCVDPSHSTSLRARNLCIFSSSFLRG
jgi:hypothetical protein